MTISVVIADDHHLIRIGLAKLFETTADIKLLSAVSSGEQALQLVRELQPDVVLMDIRMPGIGGIEATRKICQVCPDVKVIVLTGLNDALLANQLLKLGAAGYVTKSDEPTQLLQAIQQVMAGERFLSMDIAQAMALNHCNDVQSPFAGLSDRELQICLMLVEGEKVQSISDKLCLSAKTVNSYRYRMFDKLKVKNDVGLTRLALRHGLIACEQL